jgi:hypothetical protein
MSQTHSRLAKGKYAYSSHSLLISGDIIDVFTGVWKATPTGARALIKCEGDVPGGEPLCVIKLRNPLSIEEYREAHHPEIRPLVKNHESPVQAVLLPAAMVCTIPDYMEAE